MFVVLLSTLALAQASPPPTWPQTEAKLAHYHGHVPTWAETLRKLKVG